MTVTTGRDGMIKPSSKWNRAPVPSRPVEKLSPVALYRLVPSRKYPLPSRPVDKTCPYRPVPSTKPTPTVPSRRQNLSMPSRYAVKTCPNRQIPRSKLVPTVPPRDPLPSLLPVKMPSPSRCRHRLDAVNTVNSY